MNRCVMRLNEGTGANIWSCNKKFLAIVQWFQSGDGAVERLKSPTVSVKAVALHAGTFAWILLFAKR